MMDMLLFLYVCDRIISSAQDQTQKTPKWESLPSQSPANANHAIQSDQQNRRRLHDRAVETEPFLTMLPDLREGLIEGLQSSTSQCLCRAQSYLCIQLFPASCRWIRWDLHSRQPGSHPAFSCRHLCWRPSTHSPGRAVAQEQLPCQLEEDWMLLSSSLS